MDSKYSKGNWEINKEQFNNQKNDNSNLLCSITCEGYFVAEVWKNCNVNRTPELEESEANAKLIASAPEMLEMLERAKVEFGKYHFMHNMIDDLIKKATEQ